MRNRPAPNAIIPLMGWALGALLVALAAWQPTNPRPCSMEVSRVCLPAADMGGFLSVPASVRSPVVKKKRA